jgi:hypothetical protein
MESMGSPDQHTFPMTAHERDLMSTALAKKAVGVAASVALSGALALGATMTASATPATATGPTPKATTAAVTPAAFTTPTVEVECHRVWHPAVSYWDHGIRRVHPGFWTCTRD